MSTSGSSGPVSPTVAPRLSRLPELVGDVSPASPPPPDLCRDKHEVEKRIADDDPLLAFLRRAPGCTKSFDADQGYWQRYCHNSV